MTPYAPPAIIAHVSANVVALTSPDRCDEDNTCDQFFTSVEAPPVDDGIAAYAAWLAIKVVLASGDNTPTQPNPRR